MVTPCFFSACQRLGSKLRYWNRCNCFLTWYCQFHTTQELIQTTTMSSQSLHSCFLYLIIYYYTIILALFVSYQGIVFNFIFKNFIFKSSCTFNNTNIVFMYRCIYICICNIFLYIWHIHTTLCTLQCDTTLTLLFLLLFCLPHGTLGTTR